MSLAGPHDDAYAKDYDSLRYGSQHRDCFENHWFAVHLGSWDYDGDVEKERAAYARFFPEWVSRTDEYPPAGDQQAQWSARLESEAEKRGDCSYLKQLYEERAKNGGTPCESLSRDCTPPSRACPERETGCLVG